MERYLAISCDSHCGPQPHVIREYLDSQYREQYDETLAAEAEAIKQGITQSVTIGGSKMDTWGATPRAVYFQHERLKSGGEAALWDPARRAEEMEKDGTAAEMIFAGPGDDNTGAVGTPFTARRTPRGMTPTPEYKLRFAGANAYNRWLADMCSYDIDRHAGVIVCPLDDLTGAIEEIRRARKSGLYGGYSFPQPTVPVTNTEAFWLHPRFEPLWDTLEELDIPIQSHQSSGGINYGNYDGTRWIVSLEGHFVARRPLWQLIFSGVFERHPNLKLCLTEVGGVDIPYWLNTFDYFYEGKRGKELRQILPMKPSEYWRRQCFLGSRPLEAARRSSSGIRSALATSCGARTTPTRKGPGPTPGSGCC